MGSIVTFACDTYSPHGVPFQPTITQVRKDVNWSELVDNSASGNVSNPFHSMSMRERRAGNRREERGRGQDKKLANSCRNEWYSETTSETSTQPHQAVAPNFYHNSTRESLRSFGGQQLVQTTSWRAKSQSMCTSPLLFFLFLFFLIEVQQKYRRMFNYVGVSKALVAAFPTLEFDSSKLWSTGNIQEASPLLLSRYSLSCINLLPLGFKYYKVVENQKRAFENVAKDEGFDPLVAENWYNVDKDTLYNYPVGVCSPFYLTFFCFLLSSLSWSSHFNI